MKFKLKIWQEKCREYIYWNDNKDNVNGKDERNAVD